MRNADSEKAGALRTAGPLRGPWFAARGSFPAAVEDFLARTRADLWIQHDLLHHRTLKLAPEHYD